MTALSRESADMLDHLMALPVEDARGFYRGLKPGAMHALMARARRELGSPHGIWQRDPCGFSEDVLRVGMWSGQREIMESVRDNRRTAVRACHGPGKSFSAACLVCWFGSVWPLGTATIVTTAPRLRQVRTILWPAIRHLHDRAHLAGTVQTTQWKVGEELLAWGFSSSEYDEEAVQGIHDPYVLFIVDEAGGIGHTLGNSYAAVLSNPDPHMLLIGNPPTDNEGSWFEEECGRTDGTVSSLRVSAYDTPNFTGESTPRCTSCGPSVPAHRVAWHLTDQEFVDGAIAEFGEDSAFVLARVHAEFPTAIGQIVMPLSWVEACAEADHQPAAGSWVRVGADIAAEGGDEFVIAHTVGFTASIVHRSSGAANADPVNLAGRITQEVREACDIRERVGEERKVHVKIDASGMGWGVAGLVKRQCEEAGLPAVVLPVRGEDPPNDETQFRNARSELWWNTRRLVKPDTDPTTGAVVRAGRLKLVDAPARLLAQLSAPKYSTDSAGRIVVEKKAETKKRKGGSPDLADAVNLCLYEPPNQGGPARVEAPAPAVMPTRISQVSQQGSAAIIPLRPSGR